MRLERRGRGWGWLAMVALCVAPAMAGGCVRPVGVAAQDNVALVESQAVEAPALQAAARQIDAGDPGDAYQTLVGWLTSPEARASADRDVALYLTANALIADSKRFRAFYYLDELLDTYIGSDLYLVAVSRQYEIADSYLSGETDRFLFFARTYDNDALEMLFRIQQRAPGTELAERALLRTADYYFDEKDYDFAEDAYTVFIDRFPRSPSVQRARLKQAWSNLLQYRGPRYDPTPLLDARAQFAQYRATYPEAASDESMAEVARYIEGELAQKQLIKAGFYDRTGREESAALLRSELAERFPDTSAAAAARAELRRAPLPATVPQTGARITDDEAGDGVGPRGTDDPLQPGARP